MHNSFGMLLLAKKFIEKNFHLLLLAQVTVTGFVQETGQSYVDELDFRFNKPWIKIEASIPLDLNGFK